MDVQVPNVRSDGLREQPGAGRGGKAPEARLVLQAEAQDLLAAGRITDLESWIIDRRADIDEIAKRCRARRQALEAQQCAVCRKAFTDGRPYGNEKLRRPGEEALDLYACSPACFAQLQYQVEQKRLQLQDADLKRELPRTRGGRRQTPI